jgi:hypothetical protein
MLIHEALLPVGHITQMCRPVVNERLTLTTHGMTA